MTEVKPEDLPQAPSANDVAREVVRQLIVPKGPVRNLTVGNLRLDTAGQYPLLGSSGLLRGISITLGSVIMTISQRGLVQITLRDRNNDNVAGAFFDWTTTTNVWPTTTLLSASGLDVMFANGLVVDVNPIDKGIFGTDSAYFWLSIWYESIPIGQKVG